MMRWFILLMLFFGTSVSAQSVDQRKLSECITEANEILEFADAWRQTLEAKGERARPWDTASYYRLREMEQVLRDTFGRLEDKEAHEDIMQAMEAAAEPIFLRESLIEAMIEEAYDRSGKYDEIAVFISQCATNYGGELFTLEDEIADLRKEIKEVDLELAAKVIEHEKQITNLKAQNRVAQVRMLRPYKERIEFLCNWMKILKRDDVLAKDIFVDNKRYKVCKTD